MKMKNLLTKAEVASLREEQIAKAMKLGAAAAAVTSSAPAPTRPGYTKLSPSRLDKRRQAKRAGNVKARREVP
ncbi:UNVERIFIED_ORG: hypothetical protein GGI57_005317 [Rhizobium aethiopicum]